MSHLCLINPPGIKTTSGLQMHTPNPPIGLAYIAAAVRDAGHRVTVIDTIGDAPDEINPLRNRPDILVQGLRCDQIVQRIPTDTDVVGLGCAFSTLWPISRDILEAIRRNRPDLRIIVGGEHPSALPEHVLQTSPVDICIIGEGEETTVELLDCLDQNRDIETVKGIAYAQAGEIIQTERRPRIRDVDQIPWPAWDLFPIEAYIERHQFNGVNQGRAMPILGTRGCPYHCAFCSSARMWTTRYAVRDVSQVCDEIETYMRRYQATDFHFQDLTAVVGKRWIMAFCRELLRRNLNITWQLPSGTRCEAIDDEVCALLAATGCRNMSYAPESGSPQLLESVQKKVNLDAMRSSIRSALRHGLKLNCFFVVGLPAETPATLRTTQRLIRQLAWMGVQDVGVAKFIPYPGSVLFEQLRAAGKIDINDDFLLSPIDSYNAKVSQTLCTNALTFEQLNRWMIRLYLNFYLLSSLLRPIRTIRTLARALLTGREDTRYAKWFRDILSTRRRWRRVARQSRSATANKCTAGADPQPATF